MTTVTLSSKYQFSIPKKLRKNHSIVAGMKFQIFAYEDRIELIPIKSIKSLKGVLKGMDTNIIREKDRL